MTTQLMKKEYSIINGYDSNDYKKQAKSVFDFLDISENTKKDYSYRIDLFLGFIKDNPLNNNSYLLYKNYLKTRNDLTVSTKNKYLVTAKVFLKELSKQGLIPRDITQNVKTFRQNKKHKKEGFTQEEIKRMNQGIKQFDNSGRNMRLKAIYCLLLLQGLRQIEIIRLDKDDINLVNKTAFVQGKGSDDKELIYLHPESIKAIERHIKINKVGSGALFQSFSNRGRDRIGTRTIKREIKRLLKPLKIEKTVHGFRHYYITTLLKKLDVRDVRKFSRHKNLEMLIVYDDEIDIKEKTVQVFSCFNDLHLL